MLRGTARPRSRSRARNSTQALQIQAGASTPTVSTCWSPKMLLTAVGRHCRASPQLELDEAMARQAKNQRSTCHMAKDCSETGWGGTSLVVNATNQPLQHQTVQAEASQVSARLGFEQSSVAGMVFPPAGACNALAEVSMCGLASTTNAWHSKNSSQTARLVLCPQLPTPKGNALPPPGSSSYLERNLHVRKRPTKSLG